VAANYGTAVRLRAHLAARHVAHLSRVTAASGAAARLLACVASA